MNKDKKNNSFDFDFNFIFDNEINQKTIDQKLRKIKFLNLIIVLLFLFAIIFVFSINHLISKSNIDYFASNSLNVFVNTDDDTGNSYCIANPWIESSFISSSVFRSLLLTDSSFSTVEPELAESYSVSNDGLTYSITLKDNLFWSDGYPLTVDDVVFSFEAFLLNSNVNIVLLNAFRNIDGALNFILGNASSLSGVSVEDNVITIQLVSIDNDFDFALTQFVPLPRHILFDQNPHTITNNHSFFLYDNIICSGMFMPDVSSNFDSNFVLVHNPYYDEVFSSINNIVAHWDWQNAEVDFFFTDDISKMISFRSLNNYSEFLVLTNSFTKFDQRVYVNTSKINLPADLSFGSCNYHYDWRFDEWSFKRY